MESDEEDIIEGLENLVYDDRDFDHLKLYVNSASAPFTTYPKSG